MKCLTSLASVTAVTCWKKTEYTVKILMNVRVAADVIRSATILRGRINAPAIAASALQMIQSTVCRRHNAAKTAANSYALERTTSILVLVSLGMHWTAI
jgi:hypothetical protein